MTEHRQNHERPRLSFAQIARMAIERSVPETRGAEAVWYEGPNVAWVRWPMDGRFSYLDLHRHLDWITGEYGVASEPVALRDLPLLPSESPPKAPGARIRLGDLLGEAERSWRAGSNQRELAQRLEWMALELRVKGISYFQRILEHRAAH